MSTWSTGLVSISFRKLSPAAVAELARQAGLESLEWGGDVHVPHGDLAAAREARKITADHGLRVAAYGSYHRLVGDNPSWPSVVETARELGAPVIRVWAGRLPSAEASGAYRAEVARALEAAAAAAHEAGIRVALEYHGHTLTDSIDSAAALLEAVAQPAVTTLWQPPNGCSLEHGEKSLRSVLPRLEHVHVFHWTGPANERHPLEQGADRWRSYLAVLREAGHPCGLLLEFIRGDDPAQLLADAATLRSWLAEI